MEIENESYPEENYLRGSYNKVTVKDFVLMQEKVYISEIFIEIHSDEEHYNFNCSFNEDSEPTALTLEIFEDGFMIFYVTDFDAGVDEQSVSFDLFEKRMHGKLDFTGIFTEETKFEGGNSFFQNEDNKIVYDHYYDINGFSYSYEYKYNEAGETISTIRRRNGKFESESIYSTEKNILTSIDHNGEHKKTHKTVYENNPEKYRQITYDENDIPITVQESIMQDGKLVESKYSDGKGNLLIGREFIYNDKNERIKEYAHYYENGKIVKTRISEGICKSYADILLDCFEDEVLNKCFVNMRLTFDKLSSGQIF